MNTLADRVIKGLEQRRENVLLGRVNCIPFPFKRFRNEFVGLEKGSTITITSFTKGGKSQFTSYTFIYESLLYAFTHKSIKVKFIYFPLEETPERIFQRYISFLLYRETNGKIRISPKDLRSTDERYPLSKEILDIIKSEPFQAKLRYFEDNVIFSTETNPTGIYKFCKQYAEDHGTVYTKAGKYKDDFGNTHDTSVFDYYKQNDDSEYVIPVIDTANIVDTERGMTQKQAIDKLSEYCCKYLRNRYNMSPILIQQQAFESEGNEAYKLQRLRPSVYGLGDSKYTARDSNYVLGLFSPARFGLTEYFGYDITKFKDSIRFLEVIVGRDGEMGGIIALYFDGATCTFKELPPPNDTTALNKVYAFLKERDIERNGVSFFQYGVY